MTKTDEFRTFLGLVHEVKASSVLTLPEKVAAIEAAHDEYGARLQPAAFKAIAARLASLSPKELNGTSSASDGAEATKAPRPPKGNVASRTSR